MIKGSDSSTILLKSPVSYNFNSDKEVDQKRCLGSVAVYHAGLSNFPKENHNNDYRTPVTRIQIPAQALSLSISEKVLIHSQGPVTQSGRVSGF